MEINITRVFDAPIEQVWKVFTETEYIKRWWGPKGFTAPVAEINLQVGGTYLFCMRGAGPDGAVRDYWSTGAYTVVEPMKRIVAKDSFADPEGNVVPASYYGIEGDYPIELIIDITFEKEDGKTKLTLTHIGHPPDKNQQALAEQGWKESLDKVEETLKTRIEAEPGKKEVFITRDFNAPLKKVYDTMTDPKRVESWWAPRRFITIVDKMEVKPGGEWRYLNKDAEGNEYAFRGEYVEIEPYKKVSYTFEWEGLPGHVSTENVTFEEKDGKTTMKNKVHFDTVEDRDGMLQSGLIEGANESMTRLAELVEG